jgi:hypothetical protein
MCSPAVCCAGIHVVEAGHSPRRPRAGTDFLHTQAIDDAILQSEISVVSKIFILQPLKSRALTLRHPALCFPFCHKLI